MNIIANFKVGDLIPICNVLCIDYDHAEEELTRNVRECLIVGRECMWIALESINMSNIFQMKGAKMAITED